MSGKKNMFDRSRWNPTPRKISEAGQAVIDRFFSEGGKVRVFPPYNALRDEIGDQLRMAIIAAKRKHKELS